MKKKYALSLLGAAIFGGAAYAVPNPINQDYVVLTDADWAKVCESGNINSPEGCYGNISSPAFNKINRLTQGPLQINGLSGGGAKTVWLRQFGSGTACYTTTDNYISVINQAALSTDWLFGVLATSGLNVTQNDEAIGYGQPLYYEAPNLILIPSNTSAQTNRSYAYYQNTYLNTPQPTLYLMVISASPDHTGKATAFVETPLAGIQYAPGNC